MASDVALSLAQRTTLISLQEIERDSAVAQRRLSFGRRIVDVTDDPAQFFQARGLSVRVDTLLQRRSQIDQGISNLQAQLNGIEGLRDFLNQAIGLVDQARASNTDADQLRNLNELFITTLDQFQQLAEDTSYNGQNLITSKNQRLTVNFSDRSESKLQVGSVDVLARRNFANPNGLFQFTDFRTTDRNRRINLITFRTSIILFPNDYSFEDFLNNANADVFAALRRGLVTAVDRLGQIESIFANNVAILQNRLTFTIAYSNTLTIGRDKIVVADVNEEAAKLTALRTRSQISIGTLATNAAIERQLLLLLQ